ncbi:MAG: hypothetical protein ABIR27_03920 [Dokdonella sp.]
MSRFVRVGFQVLVFFVACMSSQVYAQATRTWVSGVGDDANPCSRTAPCKTFAGAISKTAAGGVIDALDPAGFGAVTITKSITIEADGAIASVLVSGTNGIIINAANVDVVLRNIKFVGLGTGLNGIRFLQGSSLLVEKSSIEGFTQSGISIESSTAMKLSVLDSVIRGNGSAGVATGGGITIQPTTSGSVRGILDHVQIVQNLGSGLRVGSPDVATLGPISLTVRDSVTSTSSDNGILVAGGNSASQVMLDNVLSAENGVGVFASGANALIRMSGSTVHGNTQGIQATVGGQVVSFGDNRIRGNIGDGAPTSTVSTK